MPEVGDRDIGLNIGNHSWGYYKYMACPGCGYTRWVAEKPAKSTYNHDGTCRQCHGVKMRGKPKPSIRGANNPAWKGGRTLMKTGYIRVPIYVDDPYISMASGDWRRVSTGMRNHHWIVEHRYVMAKHLGRCLERWEIVHHKNGDKTDNRLENLELLMERTSHMSYTLLQQEVKQLRECVRNLETRITILEAERVLTQG